MRTMINENQRGLLFRNGRFVKLLEPGFHQNLLFGRKIEIVGLDAPLSSPNCRLDLLLRDEQISSQTVRIDVKDGELALHTVNGLFEDVLKPGRYAFWTVFDKHEFRIVDVTNPEVPDDVPAFVFAKIPSALFLKAVVADYYKGRLYFDGKFIRLLEPGTYYFWQGIKKVACDFVDARLTQLDIAGQEILTQDKVSLRINVVCHYKIADFVKIVSEVDNYTEQMHVAIQMALRDFVGKYRLDEILENKDQISAFIFSRLKEQEAALFVNVLDAGVKDIVLPGEIREIMNTVLVAEKRAQANVVTRREEVASTRSLLNTAKLMEENQTLYKLKEMEYLEKICEHVGNINVSGSGDLLSQLANIIKSVK